MTENKILYYKERPLIRRGNMIYYGDPSGKCYILLIINASKKVKDIDVSTNITIQLKNREKVMKKAEREGMYAAMDIAEYWLNEALES